MNDCDFRYIPEPFYECKLCLSTHRAVDLYWSKRCYNWYCEYCATVNAGEDGIKGAWTLQDEIFRKQESN